jgi:regulator of sigma E protease
MSWIVTFLAFAGIVAFHEFGHFLFAKLFGMKVDVFSVGFGKRLFGFKWRETDYRISLIPLGGYVKLWDSPFVEDLDSKDPNFKNNFAVRPIYQRFLVLVGGPLFNFLLAIILLAGLFHCFGQPVGVSTVIDQVVVGLPAEKSGLASGDEIIAVNGNKIKSWEELVSRVQSHEGSELKVGVRRGENHLEFSMVPEIQEGRKLIGISPRVVRERLELIPAIREGSRLTWVNAKLQLGGLAGMFSGRTSRKDMAGPVGIFQATNQAAQSGLESDLSDGND